MIQAIKGMALYREKVGRKQKQATDRLVISSYFPCKARTGLGTIDNWLLNLRLLLFIRIKAQENFSILSIETGLLEEFSCYLSALDFSEDQIDSFSLVAWNCKASNPHPYF